MVEGLGVQETTATPKKSQKIQKIPRPKIFCRVTATASRSKALSGACDFKGAVSVAELKISLSGASDVTIKGTATDVQIESSGASDFKGFDLTTDFCKAKASGASDVNITVNKVLIANASGASDIYYKGNAELKESHASGVIRPLEFGWHRRGTHCTRAQSTASHR